MVSTKYKQLIVGAISLEKKSGNWMLPSDRKLTSGMTLVMTLFLWLLVFNYAKSNSWMVLLSLVRESFYCFICPYENEMKLH